MNFQPSPYSYRSNEFVKQLPLKLLNRQREPLRQLKQYNSSIAEQDDRWENSPEVNSQNYLLNPHISLYNKFSATITSFQKAYRKEQNQKNKKNKSFRTKQNKNKIKMNYSKQAKPSIQLQKESKTNKTSNYQTLIQSYQQQIDKENKQSNTRAPLQILRKPIKLIPQQTKNYYNTGLNDGKNLIKNVEINFRDIFQQSSLKSSHVNQTFSLNKKVYNTAFQNKRDQVSKKRVTVTAQYLRKKLVASSKKKLKPNQSQTITSAKHKKTVFNQFETLRSNKQNNSIIQSHKENSQPCAALNNLIFQFLQKQQQLKLRKVDKLQLTKTKVFDSQNILGSSSKQFIRAIKSNKKVK